MISLDPRRLLSRLSREIPAFLHRYLLLVGSLAAAYHYRDRLKRHAVNTKDADVVVHPAGDVKTSRALAEHLLALGWTRTEKCWPSPAAAPADALRMIRLHPPDSRDYFVELLALAKPGQKVALVIRPLRLPDGWYGIGSHRFMRLAAVDRLRSKEGIDTAAPWMMALSNLLSHPTLGASRMSDPVQGRSILRAAKDLGRVLALAWLEGREGTERWPSRWRPALRRCFPREAGALARRAGNGLRALLADPAALGEAHLTTQIGLLRGEAVGIDALRVVAERLLADALDPLARG